VATEPPAASRDRRVAFIGGLVGALVGGLFSLGGTWLTLHDQAHRESEARDRLAVGTARVMVAAFDNGVRYLCRAGKENRFLSFTPHMRPEVTTADRELVAGELTSDEALAVAEGDQAMANWEGLYEDHRETYGPEGYGFNPWRAGLHRGVGRAMDARIALEGIADYDPKGREPCDTKEWKIQPSQ
jgi:hypothetical protein